MNLVTGRCDPNKLEKMALAVVEVARKSLVIGTERRVVTQS